MLSTVRSSTAKALASLALLGGLAASLVPAQAHAAESRVLCVFDPAGAAGDAFRAATDFGTAALGAGIDFQLKPYTDEATAAADLRAGKCDAALMTGVRAGQFGVKTYALESMGALPDYPTLKSTLQILATDAAAPLLKSGDYEVLSVFPGGSVHLFLRDRTWSTKADLTGKKISTLSVDKAARKMVQTVGAQVVAADVGTFASMFNNGSVDICYAPATAYKPLELERGLVNGGGILRYVLAQMTLQLVARDDKFTDEFSSWARTFAYKNFDQTLKIVRSVESRVDDKYWTDIPAADRDGYDLLMRDVRVQLRDEGIYDGTMLKLMRRVRCKNDPSRAECAEQVE